MELFSSDNDWFELTRQQIQENLHGYAEDGAVALIIKIGARCRGAHLYHGATIQISLAKKMPELLPPYKGHCEGHMCECDIEGIDAEQTLPPDTPVVLADMSLIPLADFVKRRDELIRKGLLL